MTAPPFPTAHQIAQAIVVASKLLGENPTAVADKALENSPARCLAAEALAEAFPKAPARKLAMAVGFKRGGFGRYCVKIARSSGEFSDVHVDEVVGAVVAAQYGERAL